MPESRPVDTSHPGRGPGRILVAAYGVLALAATGRSILQIVEYFDRAPLSYILSAAAALIYIVATIGMLRGDRSSTRVAFVACTIELVGVLVVGALSNAVPDAFPDKTVWSHFGAGYGYVPLVLPVLGVWWLTRVRRSAERNSAMG